MAEAGQRQRAGAQSAADLVGLLENQDPPPAARQIQRTDQPVVTGADDDGVIISHAARVP